MDRNDRIMLACVSDTWQDSSTIIEIWLMVAGFKDKRRASSGGAQRLARLKRHGSVHDSDFDGTGKSYYRLTEKGKRENEAFAAYESLTVQTIAIAAYLYQSPRQEA